MIVTLDEMKNAMKIDTNDDDDLILEDLEGAIALVKGMLRVEDFKEFTKQQKSLIKRAIKYATTYFYDFRENKSDKILELNLRSMLTTLREVKF